jgi:hypothetical protein
VYSFSSFLSDSCTNLFFVGECFPSFLHLPIIPIVVVTVPVLCVI